MSARLPFNVPFSEAVDHFADSIVLTREEYDRLGAWAKRHGFTAARVSSARVLQDMKDSLLTIMEDGGTLADFQDVAQTLMTRHGWAGTSPWHLETIFRTNTQFAYGVGRREQQLNVIDDYPFLRYDAINDSRVRKEHADWDGTVLPQDDPFWIRAYPPSGYNCRCDAEELTADEARAIGIDRVNLLPDDESEWGSPGASDEWVPDLRTLDRDLRLRVEEALARYDADAIAE